MQLQGYEAHTAPSSASSVQPNGSLQKKGNLILWETAMLLFHSTVPHFQCLTNRAACVTNKPQPNVEVAPWEGTEPGCSWGAPRGPEPPGHGQHCRASSWRALQEAPGAGQVRYLGTLKVIRKSKRRILSMIPKTFMFILFCFKVPHLNCKLWDKVQSNKPLLSSLVPSMLNRDHGSSNPISIYFILKIFLFWPPIFRSPIGFCFHKWIFPQSWQKIYLISNFSKLK